MTEHAGRRRLIGSASDPVTRTCSAARPAPHAIVAQLRRSRTAAFATLGDPNLHSTFAYVAAAVHELDADVYKGGSRLHDVLVALDDAGRLDDAVYGEQLGLDGERIAAARALRQPRAPYLSTIMVPAPTELPRRQAAAR